MFGVVFLTAALVDIAGIVILLSPTPSDRSPWLTDIFASFVSLAATCSVGASLEVLLLAIAGCLNEFDLLMALGWATFAAVGFVVAIKLARSRWCVAAARSPRNARLQAPSAEASSVLMAGAGRGLGHGRCLKRRSARMRA
jgi:hypothetical protein